MRKYFYIPLLFWLLLFAPAQAQIPPSADTSKPAAEEPKLIGNPSVWISECYSSLNRVYLYETDNDWDTVALYNDLRQHMAVIEMLRREFYGQASAMNIRSVHNIKMRVATVLADLRKWQLRVHKQNEILVEQAGAVLQIRTEIESFNKNGDSVLRKNFESTLKLLSARQQEGEKVVLADLRSNTLIENKIREASFRVFVFHSDISNLLQDKEAALVKQELPPVWRAGPSDYPSPITAVVAASFRQTLESVEVYGKTALWRIVIFRMLILLFCLVPIKIFNDRQRTETILESHDLVFLAKFPKTASVVMGMALSPLIFVHPPHAFMEFILIGLTTTVTMLTLRNYPMIEKGLVIPVIIAFVVLYLINFFVTPTFIGRLIYTASILLLVPLWSVFRRLPRYQLRHPALVKWFLGLLAVHLAAGWILVVLGYYTLGRAVILAGISILLISMILRVAIFTLLDYLMIIAYFLNKKAGTVQIRTPYLIPQVRRILFLVAAFFLAVSYLYILNLQELVSATLNKMLTDPHNLGAWHFTWLSVILFFGSVYISFILATLIRNTFDARYERTVETRSSFGSYLLLLRLLVLCSGFIVALMISGVSVTNFTIFLGALGVGIGLGIQNLISNLISGLIIAFERPFVVGDLLDFGSESGKVKEVSLRATMVSTSDGADILIPNNTLLSQNLKNWTISSKTRTASLTVLTAHEADPEVVVALINGCLDRLDSIDRATSGAYFTAIIDCGLSFTVKLTPDDIGREMLVKSRLLTDVHEAFEKNGIGFPDTGHKGQ